MGRPEKEMYRQLNNVMALVPTGHRPAHAHESAALFVSAYKQLIGGNKRESRQTLCLFPPILAYVVSRFRDLNYEKQKARSEKIFA